MRRLGGKSLAGLPAIRTACPLLTNTRLFCSFGSHPQPSMVSTPFTIMARMTKLPRMMYAGAPLTVALSKWPSFALSCQTLPLVGPCSIVRTRARCPCSGELSNCVKDTWFPMRRALSSRPSGTDSGTRNRPVVSSICSADAVDGWACGTFIVAAAPKASSHSARDGSLRAVITISPEVLVVMSSPFSASHPIEIPTIAARTVGRAWA